ncbi:hypothetical protein, partial [Frankia sp. AgKG'84/4]
MLKLAGTAILGVLTACSGDAQVRSTATATPQADPSGARLENFAAVRISSDAGDLAVQSRTNAAGQPMYLAHFSTTPNGARALRAAHGLGGALLRPAGIDAVSRARLAIEGESVQTPFGCRAISPQDPQVQREVFIIIPTATTAVVHLPSFRMP